MAVTPPGPLSLFRIIVGPALGMIDKIVGKKVTGKKVTEEK